MLRYAFKRILFLIPTIIIISFIVFSLLELAPGSSVLIMASESMSEEEVRELEQKYDLDKPMIYRYGKYMLGLFQGDLGTSQTNSMPVWESYISKFPMTVWLSLTSLVVGVVVAVPLGIFAAKYSGTIWDSLTTAFSLLGLSLPGFWLGLLLLYAFAGNWLKIFPVGYDGTIKSFVLPSICSGLLMAAAVMRQTRSAMLDVSREDYLRTARAKGAPEIQVTVKHKLKNACIPIVTTIGMCLTRMLAGSAIVEAVFTWPGVGRLTVVAVSARDVPLIVGCVILTSIFYVVMLLIVDMMYAVLDPRTRSQYAPIRKRRSTE